ncbi:MAG: hypothetical protein KDA78_05650 [Planctomycetaceae bacterium]|nr:hypothetical protein [Planctomycetaceae bacterium]
MSGYTESLTIEILADSSGFQSVLSDVLGELERLNGEMLRLGEGERAVSRLGGAFSRMMSPLSQVSNRLRLVASDVRRLSGMSVSLDVSPALCALSQLSAAIARVASQLSALGGSGGGIPAGLPGGFPSGGTGGNSGGSSSGGGGGGRNRIRRYESGGLVTGRSGIDRVPALLTAGEYVLERELVNRIGSTGLDGMGKEDLPGRRVSQGNETSVSSTVHQYGEISIHVRETADVGALLQDLEFEGHRLRYRRG